MSRLDAQMAFLMEADRLKAVERANVLMDNSRAENAAEHSWHLCLWAMVMAPLAPGGVDQGAVLDMLLLHDIVEIDAGDTPIDQPRADQAQAEQAAADRLFALLPKGQAAAFRALWDRFEAAADPSARWAKALDHAAPVFQVLDATPPRPDHRVIVRDNLATGRAARLATDWPAIHAAALARQSGQPIADPDLAARLRFLAEADRLKSITRATRLTDGSRFENSAEHSWHLALFARTLAEHAPDPVSPQTLIGMLTLHDLVEIDAGDAPIFGQTDAAAIARDEAAAADRLFALLPRDTARAFRALWDRFEAHDGPDARFAKALDRFQPPNLNLANGGGSWVDYAVTEATVRARVGVKISAGAPALWDWISPRIAAHFAAHCAAPS